MPAVLISVILRRKTQCDYVRMLYVHSVSTHVWCPEKVLQYYESQARSNNNRGREAACHCMAELVRKLESPAILPYLSRIMKALLSAFRDDSWPVNV